MTVHFDIDKYIRDLLDGDRREISLSPETIDSVKDASLFTIITIKSQSHITADVLEKLPNLKCIVTRTVGTDHIDIQACKDCNVAVYNIPNYGSQHIAQHAVALMLAGARNIVSANEYVHKGNFDYKPFLGISLDGKTLGVIGTGRIGLEFIKIAKALGMKVIGYDIYHNDKVANELGFSYVELNELLQQSDVITLHMPLTEKTYHMLNTDTLKRIKEGAILVNTARGDLIDTHALIANAERFHAICLDVVEGEGEFSKDHLLLQLKNVIMTPHIAFFSDEALKTIAKETMKNIERFEKGNKTNKLA